MNSKEIIKIDKKIKLAKEYAEYLKEKIKKIIRLIV